MHNKIVAVLETKMDGDLDRAEAKGQIKGKGLRYCLEDEGESMAGGMESQVLCIMSQLCLGLEVLLRSRWQS